MSVAAVISASVKTGSFKIVNGVGAARKTEIVLLVAVGTVTSMCTRNVLSNFAFLSVWQPQMNASAAISTKLRLIYRKQICIVRSTKPQYANKVKNYGKTI